MKINAPFCGAAKIPLSFVPICTTHATAICSAHIPDVLTLLFPPRHPEVRYGPRPLRFHKHHFPPRSVGGKGAGYICTVPRAHGRERVNEINNASALIMQPIGNVCTMLITGHRLLFFLLRS